MNVMNIARALLCTAAAASFFGCLESNDDPAAPVRSTSSPIVDAFCRTPPAFNVMFDLAARNPRAADEATTKLEEGTRKTILIVLEPRGLTGITFKNTNVRLVNSSVKSPDQRPLPSGARAPVVSDVRRAATLLQVDVEVDVGYSAFLDLEVENALDCTSTGAGEVPLKLSMYLAYGSVSHVTAEILGQRDTRVRFSQ